VPWRTRSSLGRNGRKSGLESKSKSEADECFRQAIEIARSQGDKRQELAAITDLARLLKSAGRGAEARAALSEIYNWFTEGFDTLALKEAKSLLAELNRRTPGYAR
jgi:predicted ATPase